MKKKRSGDEYRDPTGPPECLVRGVTKRTYWPGFHNLMAVVGCPFPRPDGSLMDEPGYDVDTGTLYAPTVTIPKVKDRPTQNDARAA